jgi:hypothetical protein
MLGTASQKFIPIKTIRDGLLILNNNEYRAVLMTNSLNLALKGEDEQTAIIKQFQAFFNSLDFPVQIFVQSRRADISPYIALLNDRVKSAEGELLKLQIVEYIDYIKTFSESINLMTKHFFVVVPYVPATISSFSDASSSLFSFGKKEQLLSEESKNFSEIRQQMLERVSVVTEGLTRCGLHVSQLGTEELIELFYELFNPGDESKSVTTQ